MIVTYLVMDWRYNHKFLRSFNQSITVERILIVTQYGLGYTPGDMNVNT
jgi:hypothetical protein